jgi:hypothetical protein
MPEEKLRGRLAWHHQSLTSSDSVALFSLYLASNAKPCPQLLTSTHAFI